MSVAAHLGIDLREYDRRIRTFIPHYDEMLDAAAAAVADVARRPRTIVDVGTGTGALAARCLRHVMRARVIGLDSDAAILRVAERRMRGRLEARDGDFTRGTLPVCDAMTASFALHHISSPSAKQRFYGRAFSAVRRGGVLVSADCFLPATAALTAAAFRDWRAHLERSYPPKEAGAYLKAWGREDTYFTLDAETRFLERAGFRVDVVWRRGAFAVVAATR